MATIAEALAAIQVADVGIKTFGPPIMEAIHWVAQKFHKAPGTSFTTAQATAAQVAALNGAKPDVIKAAAAANLPLPGDEELAKLIEFFYQVDKFRQSVNPNSTAIAPQVVSTLSPTLNALTALSTLFTTAQAEISQVKQQ